MSLNNNPLANAPTFTLRHVIVAFEYTEDAASADLRPDATDAVITGKVCNGAHKVLVNEFADTASLVTDAIMDWLYFSPSHPKTTSYSGSITVKDSFGGVMANKLNTFAKDTGVSIAHMAVAWRIFFITETGETIYGNPLIVNIVNFGQSLDDVNGRSYLLNWVATYNTTAQAPQNSKLYQCTVSNPEKSNQTNSRFASTRISDEVLTPQQMEELLTSYRNSRVDRCAPMRTVGEMIRGLENQLNSQTRSHAGELQDTLAVIKNQFTKKLKPVKQKKQDELPLVYEIEIDEVYKSYKLDNRNLLTEQTEQSRSAAGVSSVTFPAGITVYEAIDTILTMSREIGKEHSGNTLPEYTYRINVSMARRCDGKLKFSVYVNRFIRYNLIQENDGTFDPPNDTTFEGNIRPLMYQFQTDNSEDNEVVSVTYSGSVKYDLSPLEDVTDEDNDDAGVVVGDRELQTFERSTARDYFTSGFSGVRTIRDISSSNMLESASDASQISIHNELRDTICNLEVIANPYLLSDLAVNPVSHLMVKDGWGYYYYDSCHLAPMYLRAKLFIQPYTNIRGVDRAAANAKLDPYYYDGYMQIIGVRTSIYGSNIMHNIRCIRSEPNF